MTAREKALAWSRLRQHLAQFHDQLLLTDPGDPKATGALWALNRVLGWMDPEIAVRMIRAPRKSKKVKK